MTLTTHKGPFPCPNCKKAQRFATGESSEPPEDGDVICCADCGQLAQIGPRGLEILTNEMAEQFFAENPGARETLGRTVEVARSMPAEAEQARASMLKAKLMEDDTEEDEDEDEDDND